MSGLTFRGALRILGSAGLALISVTGYHRTIRKILPDWDAWHAQLVGGGMGEPLQYSVIAPGLAELAVRAASVEPWQAYLAERFVFLFGVALLFQRFSRRWLSGVESVLALVGFFYLYHLTLYARFQPAAEIALLLFLLGYMAIERDRFVWLLLIVSLGALNQQSVAFLIPVYWTRQALRRRGSSPEALLRTLALVVGFLLVREAIRAAIGPRPYPASMFQLAYNLERLGGGDPRAWYFVLPSLLPLLLIAGSWTRQPLLMRALAPTLPLFVAVQLVVAPLPDFRAHMPLAFVTLPAAILFLRPYLGRQP